MYNSDLTRIFEVLLYQLELGLHGNQLNGCVLHSSNGQVRRGGTRPRLTEHLPGTSGRGTRRWLQPVN